MLPLAPACLHGIKTLIDLLGGKAAPDRAAWRHSTLLWQPVSVYGRFAIWQARGACLGEEVLTLNLHAAGLEGDLAGNVQQALGSYGLGVGPDAGRSPVRDALHMQHRGRLCSCRQPACVGNQWLPDAWPRAV